MKKKILGLATLIIGVSILTSGTLAYFTSQEQVHNVITTDGVDIRIEEWQKTDKGLVSYPKDTPIHVMPGTTVSKIADVKNLEAESYIRATFEIVFLDADGNEMALSQEVLNHLVSVQVNTEDWVRKDGDTIWWYYKDVVQTDEVTENFFSEVIFQGDYMTNEYQNCKVDIVVKAQAVQAAHNGNTAVEAAGWPME